MITPDEIRDKARRLLGKAIAAWLAGEPIFPYRIPADLKLPSDLPRAIESVERLRSESKEQRRYGYRIEWEKRRSRTHGQNDFPTAIYLDSLDDLSRLIGELPAWTILQKQTQMIRERLPTLESWIRQAGHWRKLIDVGDDLDGLLGLTEYFIAHPRPGVFARRIPVASTKLLESHKPLLSDWLDRLLPFGAIDVRYGTDQFEPRYGLKYARPHFLLRPLDADVGHRIGMSFDECSLPAETLSALPVGDARVFIVENKVSVLTMPAIPNGLVLGGLGNAVTQLAEIAWLHDRPVHYWGDLDAAGFEILSRLRDLLPDVRSRLMDESTLQQCKPLATFIRPQPPKPNLNLTAAERAAYQVVCDEGIRVEQEHIGDGIVRMSLGD